MTKQIIIETPTTELAMYNLSYEYNTMRASAKKRAIEATLKAMACEHGYILVQNAWYSINSDKCIHLNYMDICEECYREQQAEEPAPVETAEPVEDDELSPDDIAAIDHALAQEDMGPYTMEQLTAMVEQAQASPNDITIYPMCGHRYSIPGNTPVEEIADLKTQMCDTCVREMIAFEAACEAEYKLQQAWNALQTVPCYLEVQAARFVTEVESELATV